MYRLQLSPHKVFTYNSHIDTLHFQKKDGTALSNEQTTKYLVELVSKRQKAPRPERPLYTVFMMRLAQNYVCLRVALRCLEVVKGTRGDKAEVSDCLHDVWDKSIKVGLVLGC
jgi:hypothetical protein